MNIKNISIDLFEMAERIYAELGGGFNETVNQNALAIELREAGIPYLKEVNIEIFYKGHSIGTDRPDFILLPVKKRWDLKTPIVLETKVSANLSNDNHQQLKSYLKSFPHNRNTNLKGITKGILLRFSKAETYVDYIDTPNPVSVELEFWSFSRQMGTMTLEMKLPENQD